MKFYNTLAIKSSTICQQSMKTVIVITCQIVSYPRLTDEGLHLEDDSVSDGKGEWSEMVRACVEEGLLACFEKSLGIWSKGQEEARTTKEEVEDASGEGEQKCWFGGDALNRARWRVGVGEIVVRVG